MSTVPDAFLPGRVVVVTGAGRGLGEAYAHLAARHGARVVLNDVDEVVDDVALRLRGEGFDAVAHVGDVSQWDVAGGLIEFAVSSFGRVDGLVSNAGLFRMGHSAAEEPDAFRRLIEVNVLGVAYCGIHAMRHMIERGSGSIVNVTSGAHAGIASMSAYAASKGAVASLTYAWAIDLQGTGVRVNALSPLAATRMSDVLVRTLPPEQGDALRATMARPEANAPAVVYLLSDRSSAVHGQIVRVDHDELSLISHPMVITPTVPGGAPSAEAVAAAFEGPLASRLAPLGLRVQSRS